MVTTTLPSVVDVEELERKVKDMKSAQSASRTYGVRSVSLLAMKN